MHDAIYAQPGVLRLVNRPHGEALADAGARLRACGRVVVTGVGSSWHAARVGELLLARVGRLGARVRALHASELAGYWVDAVADAGLVAVTHRGTRATVEALACARSAGGPGVAVTGKGGALAGADVTLHTVDTEASAAHTVGYTAALAVLVALAAVVGGDEDVGRELDQIPDYLALLLGQESWEELAARFGRRRCYWVVGGGPNAATAREGALKLAEAAHVTALGHHCEEFLHGPWVAMTAEDLLVVVASAGPSRERCVTAARAAREVGTPVLAIAREDDTELAGLATETVALPRVDELLSPILAVVPLQLLAYHLAVQAGTNPDTMRADETPYGRARAVIAS